MPLHSNLDDCRWGALSRGLRIYIAGRLRSARHSVPANTRELDLTQRAGGSPTRAQRKRAAVVSELRCRCSSQAL